MVVKLGFYLFGSLNSCLTMSNLGKFTLNDRDSYIEKVDMLLSPRVFAANDNRRSVYNCGIISFDNSLYVNFSRYNAEAKLDDAFIKCLKYMNISIVEINNL